MTKKIFIISVLVLLGVLSLGQQGRQDKKDISAYIVKVIRDVNMKSPATGWQKAIPLSQLKSGYEVKTDKGSLAMILFADQSKLILREKSIVTIKGEVQGKEILSRSVHMDRGNMIFNVKKAETEQFRFSSPISVASIRGTVGGYNTGGNADYLTISEGLAEFTNSISRCSTNVSTGHTGVADSSGNCSVRDADKKELDNIRRGAAEGEGGGHGETSTSKGVVVSGSIAFDPSPVVGNQTTTKLDLSQTDTTISSVKLFYRVKGTTEYKQIAMVLNEKVASANIPAADVLSPALEYYFVITIGKQSIDLPTGGARSPGSISVAKAVSATANGMTVTATPVFNPSPVRSFINVQSTLDLSATSVNLNTVMLFYRRGGDAAFKQLALTLSGKMASGTIPGIDVRAPGLDYYFVIKLLDSIGTEITLPSDGISNPLNIVVPPLTRIVPQFSQLKSKAPGTVRVDFSSLQANVNGISLFNRKKDEQTFTELILTPSGQVATGQLLGERIKFPRLDYYLVIRFNDGSTVSVPQDGATNPTTVAVQPVQRELHIPGQTGSLQKKVIVLRWSE